MKPTSLTINTLLLIIMLTLAIPTGAIMISSQALPGDATYGIKRAVENVASFIFSPSYQAKSDLQIKLIEHRIKENQQLLLASGSTEGLDLLVAQAETAKEYVLSSTANKATKSVAVKKLVATLNSSKQTLEKERDTMTPTQKSSETPPPTPVAEPENPTISHGNTEPVESNDISITINPTPNLTNQSEIPATQKTQTTLIDNAVEDLEAIINELNEEAESQSKTLYESSLTAEDDDEKQRKEKDKKEDKDSVEVQFKNESD